jgi:hypothetical protein
MTPDHLRIAVRPRGILECLDLASLFCVRRGVGIALAVLLGAAPIAWLNVALLGPVVAEDTFVRWPLWLALETPWAMAPLTLFLGRAMFAERLKGADWRGIAAGFVSALLPLLLYQTLLRGISLLFVVTFPFFVVTLYFVDPVILLEQGPTSGVWRRSMGLARGNLERVILAVVIDTTILVVGWVLGTAALDQLASLWAGRPMPNVFEAPEADFGIGRAVFTWHGQIAFWGVTALITVFRFITYLDTRIRNEGWDVELKLRSPAPYAGLERWRGMAVILALGAVLLASGAAAAPFSSADTDPVTAIEGDAGGTAARDAVVRQRFPWYDADQDRYRPVVNAERSGEGMRLNLFDGASVGWLVKGAMILLLLMAVAAGVWVLLRHGVTPVAPPEEERRAEGVRIGAEQIETLPEEARGAVDQLLPRVVAALAAGDHAGAAILYHAWQLVELHARGVIELAKGKTNRRYAAEIKALQPALAEVFAATTSLSERARFGRLPVTAEEFEGVWRERDRFGPAIAVEATP